MTREKLEEARRNKSKDSGLFFALLDHYVPLDDIYTFNDLQGYNQNYIATLEEISMFLKFWDGERQMFSFDPSLAIDLSRTEIGDIPWDAVKLPYNCFFVSFGPILQHEKVFAGRRYRADGFYVDKCNETIIPEFSDRDCLRITITMRLIEPTYEEARQDIPCYLSLTDPTYNFMLIGRCGDTMDEVFRDSIEANRSFERSRDANNFQNSLMMADDMELEDDTRFPASYFLHRFERGIPLIEEALPAIFNLILYLGHGPELPNPVYEEQAPKSLIQKVETAQSDKKKRRMREELDRLGYSKIRFIRDVDTRSHVVLSNSGVEIRPHWRRGHWRMQPHGPKLSLLKLVWVRPTVIHKDKMPETPIGRMYDVSEQKE